MTYKAEILKAISRLGNNGTANPDGRHNAGRLIGNVYLWEVATELCASRLKDAWRMLSVDEVIPSDDELRQTVSDETLIAKSPHFAISAKVGNPRLMFDKDQFIDAVSTKFKIDKHKLVELAKDCKTESKPPLSKKVLEIDA